MNSDINWEKWIISILVIVVIVELIIYFFTGSLTVTFESLGGVAAAVALIVTIYYNSKQNELLKREVDEISRKAEISFDGLLYNYFVRSVRVFLKVKNETNMSVANAVCLISINDMKGLRNYIESNGNEIITVINKVLNDNPRMWDPLINAYNGFREVNYEPISWNVWLDTGLGTEDMRFRYLTIIPAKGVSLAELMDIYKCELNGKTFYILRVFSEYGPEQKPKVIFKLPIGEGVKIVINVVATGDRVKNTAESEVIIEPTDDNKDYQIKIGNGEPQKFAGLFGLFKIRNFKIPESIECFL